ncbi:phage neck terminator protein [Leptospira alexanderi]|uniref:phage neck terminator protein n=1 Tax=Leptospira alexanderi TaxID=100053 RepID=UPI0009911E94|nr:hypothetical protein [Leptospira alexanderi]
MADTSPSTIRSLMSSLSEYLGVQVIRKNQDGPRPAYPYCGYGVLARNKDLASLHYAKLNSDSTKVSNLYVIPESVKISLSFYNANTDRPLDVLYDLSAAAREWLEIHGKAATEAIGVICDDFGAIQDRTTLLDVVYEYQAGFDFRVRGYREFELTVDAVDLESTYNAIDWESNV